MNTLYYGDNLKVLREHIKDETVDLIYLDPPFNSNRSYNVLFKDESGTSSESQITAFDDSWHWGPAAQQTYEELLTNAPGNVASMINSLHQFIGTNQMMAYLVMMAARLIELHRVLKPTGSLYLHCDSTASHYLKILLDMVFGPNNYQNEIIWKRTTAHNDPQKWGRIHDTIFFYTKSSNYRWNLQLQDFEPGYLETKYRFQDEKGRYRLDNMSAPAHGSNAGRFEWHGFIPPSGRMWRYRLEKLQELDSQGLIYWTPKGRGGKEGFPQLKLYLDSNKLGVTLQDIINDISPINSQAAERLGFPTQKPLVLLERIIQASSNPGDVILDPFSGCGTCIAAAQKLGREWIGIDVTHLAIAMHKARLKDMFGLEPKRDYKVVGEPEDISGARQLATDDRYQFQWWALSLIKARPLGGTDNGKTGKKGSDKGIDGVINFIDDRKGNLKRALVQVKSGHVKSGDIRDLKGTLDREEAQVGIFITLENPTRDMVTEAITTGSYHSDIWDKDFPRIQILSVEELLNGAEVKLPPSSAGAFKQAEKVEKDGPKQTKLGF